MGALAVGRKGVTDATGAGLRLAGRGGRSGCAQVCWEQACTQARAHTSAWTRPAWGLARRSPAAAGMAREGAARAGVGRCAGQVAGPGSCRAWGGLAGGAAPRRRFAGAARGPSPWWLTWQAGERCAQTSAHHEPTHSWLAPQTSKHPPPAAGGRRVANAGLGCSTWGSLAPDAASQARVPRHACMRGEAPHASSRPRAGLTVGVVHEHADALGAAAGALLAGQLACGAAHVGRGWAAGRAGGWREAGESQF